MGRLRVIASRNGRLSIFNLSSAGEMGSTVQSGTTTARGVELELEVMGGL